MSKRSIRKVRHFTTAPTFKERVAAGKLQLGVALEAPVPEDVVIVDEAPHVHGEGCDHGH